MPIAHVLIAWENSWHFETTPLVSLQSDVWETSPELPYWSHITIQIWVVPRHQYRISSFFSQTSFCRETSGSIGKCWLFTQASFLIILYIMLWIQMSYWKSLKRRNKQERMQRKKLMSLKVGPNIFSTCTVHKISDFPTNQEEVPVIHKINFTSNWAFIDLVALRCSIFIMMLA